MRYEIIEHEDKLTFKQLLKTTLETYETSSVCHFDTQVVRRINGLDGEREDVIVYIAILQIHESEKRL